MSKRNIVWMLWISIWLLLALVSYTSYRANASLDYGTIDASRVSGGNFEFKCDWTLKLGMMYEGTSDDTDYTDNTNIGGVLTPAQYEIFCDPFDPKRNE